MSPRSPLRLVFWPLLAILSGLGGAAHAGGSGENVLLVVNQNSQDSLTLANYYTRLRDIPPECVLYLDYQGPTVWANYAAFREDILAPVLKTIDKRKLSAQIDYVVYSSDFPWAVKLHRMIEGQELPAKIRPFASLTGATYLYAYALARSPSLMGLNTNWYSTHSGNTNLRKCTTEGEVRSRAFRSRYRWARNGERVPQDAQGQRYLLSCMLGVTAGRGNTVEEVARCLVSAQAADATRPAGTFYYLQSKDPRSQARDQCFPAAIQRLKAEGADATLQTGATPTGPAPMAGLTVGAPKVKLSKAGPRLLPGAFCDNLTSYGGDLRKDTSQTPISDYIRAGAAGASGTVFEPFALQAKFPLPSVHLHYFRGCSLAEAFYQSVAAPYQILLVGDPLCQPWATRPTCDALMPEGKPVTGVVQITPQVSADTAACELYMDGRLRAIKPRGETFELNASSLSTGYHELRLAAVRGDAIQTRGVHRQALLVGSGQQAPLRLTLSPENRVPHASTLQLTASGGQDPKKVVFLHNSRVVGEGALPGLSLEIPAEKLGQGPARLQAVDPISGERSEPVWVWVQ